MLNKLKNTVLDSQIKRSIFRVGIPNTDRKRVLIVLGNVFLHLHPTKVRTSGVKLRYTWCAGGLSFFLFLVLTLTGVLLMFYYRPTVEGAYVDMLDMRSQVPFGIMRELHRWSAHAMVIMVMVHMFRVFMTGSYKPPREFNWTIGVLLLVLTFLLSFTGYLLPWDQLAIWAITVGSNIMSAVPAMGQKVRFLMLGGNTVNANALLRFYVLHCMILPLGLIVLIAIHFWRIRKDGGLYPGPEPKPVLIPSGTENEAIQQ